MFFPERYDQSAIMVALKSRRGYLRNSIVKKLTSLGFATRLGCVFVTMDDELTEYWVRQNISMCTRKFESFLDCSPISKDDYEQSK